MKRLWLASLVAATSLPVLAAVSEPASLTWASVFGKMKPPEHQHFVAVWFDEHAAAHRVEVWREGESAVRRDTDERLSVYATKTAQPGSLDMEPRYEVVDHARKLFYEVDRSNLNRLGIFYDWDQLAHAMKQPGGPYRLSRLSRPTDQQAGTSCTWYLLQQPSGEAQICWSQAVGLPLAENLKSTDGAWREAWRVVSVDDNVRDPDVTFNSRDYIRFDANEDLAPGAD
ncbi:hypothetical protein AAGS40_28490 (plasmid) [Paraburkholderia sp. PREW-6R]|uniref:hypothetical protein n=1 Tax=Paraburkholderia sp. PREW-6R TaxID=3141544 RepID=UPI0031F5A351